MNRFMTPLCLSALAFVTLQMPALADFNIEFGNHDRNHDHRWNFNEFHHANRYYYQQHPEVQIITRRDSRRHFVRLDADGDGYLNMDEARVYRNWD